MVIGVSSEAIKTDLTVSEEVMTKRPEVMWTEKDVNMFLLYSWFYIEYITDKYMVSMVICIYIWTLKYKQPPFIIDHA